jgi:hypothetical protein
MTTDIKRGRFSYPRGNDAGTTKVPWTRQELEAAIDSAALAHRKKRRISWMHYAWRG